MNVLIILGHPRTDSYCGALTEAYHEGARQADIDVRKLAVADLEFDPDVHTECPSDQPIEADLREAQRDIEWADHLVFVYPNWWGTMPARLKGFFDRLFRPGFAFKFHQEGEGAGHEKLLNDKTAELIVTMDMPPWVYRWIYRQPGNNAVKRATLGFAGIRTTRVTNVGSVENSSLEQRQEWLDTATRLGRSLEDGPESRHATLRRKASAWLGALRLQFYPMSWVAYTVGALAVVGSSDVFTAPTYWIGFLFLFALEAATVLSNEYVDYETDRRNTFAGPFTGGSRVLVEGELGFDELRVGIGVALSLAVVFGASVLALGDGAPLAMAGVMLALGVLAIGYTIPPLKLSYRTLGELDVAVTHSLGVMLCGYVFLGGSVFDPTPWLLSLPLLLGTMPSITLAGVPDYRADRTIGKRTIAVRFGIKGAALVAIASTVLATTTATLLAFSGAVSDAYQPIISLSAFHALILVWLVRTRLYRQPEPRRIDTLMIASLTYLLWFGVAPLFGLLGYL